MSQNDPFDHQMQELLGAEWSAFRHSLNIPPPTSIRLNPAKWPTPPPGAEPVPWAEGQGWYLPERPSFTLDPMFHAGAWYVQEASSMFAGWLTARARRLDATPWQAVLDLCAAPGGKTTHLLSLLPEESVLVVANEVIRSRWPALRHNLMRWGHAHALLTRHDPAAFSGLSGFFDLVLVDAPCSGEGLFRKMPEARSEWSPAQVQHCALRQQRILQQAVGLVRPGGWLLYSTCTWNRQEDEAQVAWLETQGFELIRPEVPASWDIEWSGKGWRFYPHRLRGEGFFAALLRKKETLPARPRTDKRPTSARFQRLSAKKAPAQWLDTALPWSWWSDDRGTVFATPRPLQPLVEVVWSCLPDAVPVLEVGVTKGKNFVPAAALALSVHVGEVPSVEVERDTALDLLRGQTPPVETTGKGFHLVRYKKLGLLWIKALGRRINNYLPKGWRIRIQE